MWKYNFGDPSDYQAEIDKHCNGMKGGEDGERKEIKKGTDEYDEILERRKALWD